MVLQLCLQVGSAVTSSIWTFLCPGVFLGFNWVSLLRRLGSRWDAAEGLCHLPAGLMECQHEADRTNWSDRHRQCWGSLLSDWEKSHPASCRLTQPATPNPGALEPLAAPSCSSKAIPVFPFQSRIIESTHPRFAHL